MATARSRNNIRSEKSMRREAIAKQVVEKLLASNGFTVLDRRSVRNRHLIDVRGAAGNARTLWFKLGWNPGNHGTSAVQIEMIKRRADGRAPSEWSNAEFLREVTEKIQRGADAGASDLLLFSLDAKNRTPIACLLMPLERVATCYKECLKLDPRRSRKGASPTLWLRGTNPASVELQRTVERYATENLLDGSFKVTAVPVDDAVDDLAPDPSIVGNASPERRLEQVARYPRDPEVRERARRRASGRCEYCNEEGFLMANGNRYLETHHIQALGQDGPDTEDNVIALCPNDHRAAHFSAQKSALAGRMKAILAEKLRALQINRRPGRRNP